MSPEDDRRARASAVAELTDNSAAEESNDSCGPEPTRPNYYSPQEVRDRWYAWKLCKMGA